MRSRAARDLSARSGWNSGAASSLSAHRSAGQSGASTRRSRAIGAIPGSFQTRVGVVPRFSSQRCPTSAYTRVRGVVLEFASTDVGLFSRYAIRTSEQIPNHGTSGRVQNVQFESLRKSMQGKTQTAGVKEVRANLAAILRAANRDGMVTVVTRRGTPYAAVVPVSEAVPQGPKFRALRGSARGCFGDAAKFVERLRNEW